MSRSWQKLALACGLAAALAGCAVEPRDTPFWTLAGEPGLLWDVTQYYQRHAIEEGGRCLMPQFRGATHVAVLEDTEEQLVLALGYAYTDLVRDGDDCHRLRLARCFIMRECEGFSERTFTIARTPVGLEVVDMSGLRKHRPPQP
jgi:hypothetical protein